MKGRSLTTRLTAAYALTATFTLAMLFIAGHGPAKAAGISKAVREGCGVARMAGCTMGGIIGGGHEVEGMPAISLALLSLPGVNVRTLHLTQEKLLENEGPAWWRKLLGAEPEDEPAILLLPDPFSIDGMALVSELNEAYPGLPLVGGLASGAHEPKGNAILVDAACEDQGAAVVVLTGAVRMETLVSQGCRPIGRHYVITRAQGNVIQTLGGRPALAVLQEIVGALSEEDQSMARNALLLGRVIDEHRADFDRGDFLIRNLIGADPQSGAVAVGDQVRVGQTVQFQLRDGVTADEDLRHLLADAKPRLAARPPAGALLFSCMGRGVGMYGVADHDVAALRAQLPELPVAGCFCSGEIGPIGGKNFVHGFTSSVGFLSPK